MSNDLANLLDVLFGPVLGPGGHLITHLPVLFGSHHHDEVPASGDHGILGPKGGLDPLPMPPPPPPGGGGLTEGAERAGSTYGKVGTALAGTDQHLLDTLKQIFAGDDQLRSKIEGKLGEINTRRKALADDPKAANDPVALRAFVQFVDGKLTEIQQVLSDAKVDKEKQAQVLGAISDQYKGPPADNQGNQSGSGGNQGGGGQGASQGGGNSGGSAPAGGAPAGTGAGTAGDPVAGGGLVDPLAGLGGPGMGGMGMNPLAELAPALASLGAVPAGLGGMGGGGIPGVGSLPLSELAGDRFDDSSHRHHHDPEFTDEGSGQQQGGKKEPEFTDNKGQQGQPGAQPAGAQPAGSVQPGMVAPTNNGTPSAAAPAASAGGDASRVIQFPDGPPVTAETAQKAGIVRAVMGGSGITAAYHDANIDLPAPGTPVHAADPNHLTPGMLAQYKTHEQIMYAGNDKIWLDGQLQPKSALPKDDFQGWFDPAAGAAQPAPSSPAPAPQPVPSAPPNTGT